MSNNTLSDDDLTHTQEYIVAGIVILLFGLLYWFLNHGWNSSPEPEIAANTPNTLFSVASPSASATPNTVETVETPAVATAEPAKIALPATASPAPQAPTAAAVATTPAEPSTTAVEPVEPAQASAPPAPIQAVATATTAITASTPKQSSDTPAIRIPQIQTNTATTAPVYITADGTVEKAFQDAAATGERHKAIILDSIGFNAGSMDIQMASDQQITAIVAILKQYPQIKVLVRGHADTEEANADAQLSLMRANALGVALVKTGVEQQRIIIMGMNNKEPIDTANTEEGRKKNRRVDISITE